jgi:hypothetical protein
MFCQKKLKDREVFITVWRACRVHVLAGKLAKLFLVLLSISQLLCRHMVLKSFCDSIVQHIERPVGGAV